MPEKKFATSLKSFAPYKLKRTEYHIEDLGLWVYLRELPGAHADLYMDMGEKFSPDVAKNILQAVVVNESGDPIFEGDEGRKVLDGFAYKLINDMFMKSLSVSSLSDDIVEEEKKDFAATG